MPISSSHPSPASYPAGRNKRLRLLQGDVKMEEAPQAEKAADSPMEVKDQIDGAENSHEVSNRKPPSPVLCV